VRAEPNRSRPRGGVFCPRLDVRAETKASNPTSQAKEANDAKRKIARLPADIRTEFNQRSTSQYKSVQVNPTNKKIFSRRPSAKVMPKAITNEIAEATPISDAGVQANYGSDEYPGAVSNS
jgi:uncharacterized Zn finger protein (UPF0148 family)